MATMIESPLSKLTDEQIEQLGKEFDAIHDEVFDDLGDRDRRYITSMISMHRRLLVLSRIVLLGSRYPPARPLGASAPSAAQNLQNMEIGHKGKAGPRGWMEHPPINSSRWGREPAATP